MTAAPQSIQPIISGPCVICGATNYDLSCGGPTICPKCDCGQFDAATVMTQSKALASLRSQVSELRARGAAMEATLLDCRNFISGMTKPITGTGVHAISSYHPCHALLDNIDAALAVNSQHSDGEAGR